jgi:hypothetical protein
MNSFGERLHAAVVEEGTKLRAVSEKGAESRSGGGTGWSKKEELGHLIDSATNNRVRFVKAALEGKFEGPSYDGPGWVELGGYARMPWNTLIELWSGLNSALAALVDRIPQGRLNCICRVGNGQPVTLEFLIDDYILHMRHHLDHILGRKHLTEYPGAAIGV